MLSAKPVIMAVTCLFLISTLFISPSAFAATAEEIEFNYDQALKQLKAEVIGAEDTLKKAKGILIIPGMWKAGLGLGGEYGEGALKVSGMTKEYYSMAGVSVGWQIGVQKRSIILAFMDDEVLNNFVESNGWEFGLDGSATLIEAGIDGDISSIKYNKPILAFVIGEKGLMVNATLEGYKLTRIKR